LLLPALLTFLLLEDPGVKMLDRLHDKPPLIVFAGGDDVLDFGKQFLGSSAGRGCCFWYRRITLIFIPP
jgi:hypothetical protein